MIDFIFFRDFKSSDTMTKAIEIIIPQKVQEAYTSKVLFFCVCTKQERRRHLGRGTLTLHPYLVPLCPVIAAHMALTILI